MADTAKLTINWNAVGFAEGAEAGSGEMNAPKPNFGPLEDALAMGHALLDGSYGIIRRRQLDFRTFEDMQAWLGGVVAGAGSVGARVGLQTTIEYPYSGPDGGAAIYILVTRDFGPWEGASN